MKFLALQVSTNILLTHTPLQARLASKLVLICHPVDIAKSIFFKNWPANNIKCHRAKYHTER